MSKKPAPKMVDPRVVELQATFETLGRGAVEVRSVDSGGNIVFRATKITIGILASINLFRNSKNISILNLSR